MSEPSPRLYRSHDDRFSVSISESAIQVMLVACTQSGGKETGGILIGKLDPTGSTALVLQATPKPRDSAFSWFWFRRGVKGLKQLLAERWTAGQHYLGEWHYHPGGSPEPSEPDYEAMAKIAGDGRYQCREPILVIVGGTSPDRWQLSVSVTPLDEQPYRLSARR